MAGPWEKYGNSQAASLAPGGQEAAASGPWAKYADDPNETSELPITDLPAVQAERPDFSGVTATVDSTAFDNAPDGWKYGAGRDAAFGVRSAIQGAGSLLGAFGGDAFNNYVVNPLARAAGLQEARPYREEAEAFADSIGLPQAQTAGDRIMGNVGEGLTGTALTLGAGGLASGGQGLVRQAGQFFAANPILQTAATTAGAAASSGVKEAGGGTGAQLGAGLIGGFAPGTLAAVVPGIRSGLVPAFAAQGTRGVLRGRDALGGPVTPASIDQTIGDFASVGTTPSVGQATGGRFPQALETMLGNVPGGAGPIARQGANQANATAQTIERYAEQLSPRGRPMSPEQAGRKILEGIEGEAPVAFVPKTAKKAAELYDRVAKQIAPGARVAVENTKRILSDLNASIGGAPNVAKLFQNSRIQGIEAALGKDIGGVEAALQRPEVRRQADALKQQLQAQAQQAKAENARLQALGMRASQAVASPQQIDEQVKTAIAGMADNQIPYEALTKLRTVVGKELDNYSLADNVPRDKWKALYGALTRDMEAAATTPEAQQAWKRANAYYAARSKRIDAVAHVVDKSGGPEAVYKAAFGNTKEGATTLHAVMQSLPKEAQREVSASFIRRMGRATGSQQNAENDVFSMETFLTNWANMSPEAKRVLFDRHGFGFRQDMERIARMTDKIRQGSAVFRNPSGSGRLISLITQSAGTASSAGSALVAGSPLLAAGIVSSSAALAATFNGLGRLMTSPGFVRWVAKNGEKPVGELVSQAQLLRDIAESEDNDDLSKFADQLEATTQPQTQRRQALQAR